LYGGHEIPSAIYFLPDNSCIVIGINPKARQKCRRRPNVIEPREPVIGRENKSNAMGRGGGGQTRIPVLKLSEWIRKAIGRDPEPAPE
jgi:hypothetical protein